MVLSSRSAAKATLALNAGLCERRERRPDDFLFITNSFRLAIVGQAICPESVFISAVQICGTTSVLHTKTALANKYFITTPFKNQSFNHSQKSDDLKKEGKTYQLQIEQFSQIAHI